MKKLYSPIIIVLVMFGCGMQFTLSKNYFGKYETKVTFLFAIEKGEADADDFVEAIKRGLLKYTDVSPEALANYYEAFANEGMLDQTPTEYFANQEIKTSLEVVFESNENIDFNQEVYRIQFPPFLKGG